MDTKIQEQLTAINTATNKIGGLYDRWAQKHNISQYTVCIFYCLLADEVLTQKLVKDDFKIPKQSVNNIVISLKNDGYITLEPNADDKREKLIRLTDEGRTYAEELLAPLFAIEETVIKKMGQKLVQQMIDGTTAYCNYLEQEMEKSDL
ncbi:MAG: MarR family winged helix-turn-helix transcriptional regulator [Suipraeoptans sp.]